MKTKIGVMGSAQGPAIQQEKNMILAKEVGKWIAKNNCILVNGACPGLANEAAVGAKENDGYTIGISPAFSSKEHIEKYNSPYESYDVILYTGFGLMERDIVNIRSSDGIIVIGGGIGSLNEFTIAFDEGKRIGILTGTDGISDHIEEIVRICHREDEMSNIIFDSNPKSLVEKLILSVQQNGYPKYEDQRITGRR